VTVRRTPEDFSKGLERLSQEYDSYAQAVGRFSEKLRWDYVARQHIAQYASAMAASVQTA
jgi:hypothetical protein